MNKFVFDEDGGFLIVETKWGTITIEQSLYETSVVMKENKKLGHIHPSHIENYSYLYTTVIGMVSDNKPED